MFGSEINSLNRKDCGFRYEFFSPRFKFSSSDDGDDEMIGSDVRLIRVRIKTFTNCKQ